MGNKVPGNDQNHIVNISKPVLTSSSSNRSGDLPVSLGIPIAVTQDKESAKESPRRQKHPADLRKDQPDSRRDPADSRKDLSNSRNDLFQLHEDPSDESNLQTDQFDLQRHLPPKHVRTMVRALYKFKAIDDNELSFNKDDLLEIGGVMPDAMEWLVAVHVKTKQCGYIPSNYVVTHDTSPQSQDWWFDSDKSDANKKLLQPGVNQGTFLIRDASDKISYALSIRDTERSSGDPCVRHYRIFKMDDDKGVYISSRKIFSNLFVLIDNYKERSDGLCCRLSTPYSQIAPTVQFRELEINRNKVCLSTKLGAGNFGEVWKGIYLKVLEVAVKTLKSGTMSSEAFLNEARIMHQLKHPKLVQILGVVSSEEPFYIITELMANGALLDFLQSPKGRKLKFDTLINMNSQIAEGMTFLESVNFIHRDLRAANILVGRNLDLKVADFGLARILEDEVYDANPDSKFPIKWTAPEAVWERKFSVKSDVWSFGVLMYEIITLGKPPYPDFPASVVLTKVDNGYRMEKPQNGMFDVPDSYYDMMLKCWKKKPEERPTFASMYDFFSDYFINTEPTYRELGD